MENKEELISKVAPHKEYSKKEKETVINIDGFEEKVYIYSNIGTHIRTLLQKEGISIENKTMEDDYLIDATFSVPRSQAKFSIKNPRKNTHLSSVLN